MAEFAIPEKKNDFRVNRKPGDWGWIRSSVALRRPSGPKRSHSSNYVCGGTMTFRDPLLKMAAMLQTRSLEFVQERLLRAHSAVRGYFIREGGIPFSYVFCVTHVVIDHVSLSRRGTVPTPKRDNTSNIWARIIFFFHFLIPGAP